MLLNKMIVPSTWVGLAMVVVVALLKTKTISAFTTNTRIMSTTTTSPTSMAAFTPSSSSSVRNSFAAKTRMVLKMAQEDEEDEFHPMDPARTTPQLLRAIWSAIAQGSSMVKGETFTVVFPYMADQFSPSYLSRIMAHLDACKDVCDVFGTKTVVVPYENKLGQVMGFTVKSYRNPDEKDEYEFDYDPFWDDGNEFNYDGIDDEFDDSEKKKYPEIVNRIPDDDDEIIDISKKWVDKIMSDMGICPFTSGPDMAGMPMGKVRYCIDRSTQMEDVYARYWEEVVRVEQVDEKELSTTLLIVPEFCMDNVELFENFSNTLTQPLEALGVEELLQLVFFHPHWTFRDGSQRSGQNDAANYARRSPWPMINILRTNQVRAAQKGIPTGLVYQQNEKTLEGIGTDKLETMLRLRDWSDIEDVKVNRRDMEALRIAMDLKETGEVAPEDRSVIHDVTPAANKVGDVEGSNMVNVILQALEKRLGKSDGEAAALSGPETSATIMASDFVMRALNDIAEGKEQDKPPSTPAEPVKAPVEKQEDKVAPWMQDLNDDFDSSEEDELSVLFGGGGIMEKSNDEDDDTVAGMDPRSFY